MVISVETITLPLPPMVGFAPSLTGFMCNVIAVFCGISGNVLVKGEIYVAGDCPSSCNGFLIPFPLTFDAGDYEVVLNEDDISNSLDVTFEGYSSGLFQAGNSVTLTEGFEVKSNATFLARIADCDEF